MYTECPYVSAIGTKGRSTRSSAFKNNKHLKLAHRPNKHRLLRIPKKCGNGSKAVIAGVAAAASSTNSINNSRQCRRKAYGGAFEAERLARNRRCVQRLLDDT